jgi:hypothetical protein
MVARNRVRCTVVSVPASGEGWASRGAMARDLVPWADPYVAQLIKNLQDEVRRERRTRTLVRHYRQLPLDSRAILARTRPDQDGPAT